MHAKSSARKSACTKPAAQRSSPSAKRRPQFRDCRTGQSGDPRGIGRSSNGRTTDSDSVYLGSNPSLPANKKKGLQQCRPFFFFTRDTAWGIFDGDATGDTELI